MILYGVSMISLAFKQELQELLNHYGIDNLCSIPDFILATMLIKQIEMLSELEQALLFHENSSIDDSMDGDHQSALASAGWGTDEDYE